MAQRSGNERGALSIAAIAIFMLGRCSVSAPTSVPQTLATDLPVVNTAVAPIASPSVPSLSEADPVVEPSEEPEPAYRPRALLRATDRDAQGPSCGAKTTCREMNSCAEAQHYLIQCGVSRLDRDGDGVPCESICG